jgi:hypothetical protein
VTTRGRPGRFATSTGSSASPAGAIAPPRGGAIAPPGPAALPVAGPPPPGLPLVATATGAAFAAAELAADGSGAAAARIAYLREHVAAVVRARDAGADVRAYVAWTLLDNFEWAEGYTKKFGLVRVDPEDQTRTPKASYHWYAQLAHAGSLRPET